MSALSAKTHFTKHNDQQATGTKIYKATSFIIRKEGNWVTASCDIKREALSHPISRSDAHSIPLYHTHTHAIMIYNQKFDDLNML